MRPHEALERQIPAAAYQRSARRFPARLPEPHYPETTLVRSVRPHGHFRGKQHDMFLSEVLRGDDHQWAKHSFEFSPERKPTLVTVVTRGLSDDCDSMPVRGESVYLRIAKSSRTYVFYFSLDGRNWQILRTFSLDTELPLRAGFGA